MVGHIDGVRFERGQFHIWGWACQQGNGDSIGVSLFADRSGADAPGGAFVLSGAADLASEAELDRICQVPGGRHRFQIDLPAAVLEKYRGRRIYANGVVGGAVGAALAQSGVFRFPDPPVLRVMPDAYPPLAGAYARSSRHPRVFVTPAGLEELAVRINTAGTFSARSFGRLRERIGKDLAGKTDWDATYSGGDIDVYLHAFSVESAGGYAGEIRSEGQLRAAMGLGRDAAPPRGAAVVASRLALYAALANAGARLPEGAPSPEAAAALAKRILLAWATRGFRGEDGRFFRPPDRFCDSRGRPVFPGALQISRGVVYSIHAQDLLQGLRAFAPGEEALMDAFHRGMYDWIRNTRNEEIGLALRSRHPDEVYSNQTANHLVALLAAARLLDDKRRFCAALYGGDEAIPVSLPWVRLFNYVLYGEADTPLLGITPNASENPLQSSAAYSTKIVAPGEINDRFRNLTPLQGMGYPVYTLEHLYATAEILRLAGLDAYGYRGFRRQSIEMATRYYAGYARQVGFYRTVTPENARGCPDYQQYVGKVVNGVESVILMGARRFPEDPALVGLDAAAKAQYAKENALDAIHFGLWRD